MNQDLRYYIYLNEAVQGPYELEHIYSMSLDAETKVCPEGSTEWVSLSSINSPGSSEQSVSSDPATFLQNNYYNSSEDVPSKIGKYNVVKEIGRGGMGAVYLAVDEVLNRKVAIKELKTDEYKKKDQEAYSTLLRRFKKEAQVLAQLNP
jgi:hypothetical protein